MSKVKDKTYVVIQSFMVNELDLKGNELIIYAIIYGFSQAENQTFSGSLQYLADWTNCTKQGVIKILKSLVDKGFIVKKENVINSVKFCEYYSTKFNTSSNKVEYPIKQSLPNNIEYNIEYNIDKENNKKKFENEFETLWELYPRKVSKKDALKYYIRARKKGVDYETIKNGIDNYNQYIKQNGVKKEYIKHGSTWFNQECWNDEYEISEYAKINGAALRAKYNDFEKKINNFD